MKKIINSTHKVSEKKDLKFNDKIDLDLICDTWESKNEKEQLQTFKKVIDEYSAVCGIDFRKENKFLSNDYQVFDYLLQVTVAGSQFFEGFHKILKKYGFNDKTYLDYMIKKITKNANNMQAFAEGLVSAGVISDIYDMDNGSVNIESSLGNYNFFLANEYYAGIKKIVKYIEEGDLRCNCHANALFLLKSLGKGEAVTAKCSTMFDNLYYHSYYRYEGMITDLNINCVMSEEDYNKIYNPQIISVVNIDNLEEKQNDVKSKCLSTLNDLLEIAVYEEFLDK